jgi:hypothetical protein
MPFDFLFWNEVVIPLAGMAMGLFIMLATIRAVSRHLDRKHEARTAASQGTGASQAELQQLRSQVEALEERVDFTERLLTQERNRRPLEPGS